MAHRAARYTRHMQLAHQAASGALQRGPAHCPRRARLHSRAPQLQRLTGQLMAEPHPAQCTPSAIVFAISVWRRTFISKIFSNALTCSVPSQLLCTCVRTFATAFAGAAAAPLCRETIGRETLIAGPAVPLAWSRRLNFFCAKPHRSSRSAHALARNC